MNNQGRSSIQFTLNGNRYQLSREDVDGRLADVTPDVIRKHAVLVGGIWFPVIQVFEVASGIPRSEFISHTARRHLAALGYDVAGDIESRTSPHAARLALVAPSRGSSRHGQDPARSGTPKPTCRHRS